jgi:hypothetical protein
LPLPDSPTIAVIFPFLNDNEMLSRTMFDVGLFYNFGSYILPYELAKIWSILSGFYSFSLSLDYS